MKHTHSVELFSHAQRHIPGGVNSPVRAFKGVGGDPLFIKRAQGAYMWDADGNRYIDYVGSWGPMILGHAHPEVLAAVKESVNRGLSFGAPTELEVAMADRVCELVPSMDKVRMVNSGTEATMSAIRLARGYTGRDTYRSNSRAVTTAMPMPCWSRPAPVPSLWACRHRPGSRPRWPLIP